jgi:hypothetical protein
MRSVQLIEPGPKQPEAKLGIGSVEKRETRVVEEWSWQPKRPRERDRARCGDPNGGGRHVAVAGAAAAPAPIPAAESPRRRQVRHPGFAFSLRGEAEPPRGAHRARGGAARALDAGARDGGATAAAEGRGLGALPEERGRR